MAIIQLSFYVLLFVTYCNNAQYQPLPICTSTLTTSKTSENGATVTILDTNVVTIFNNVWNIDIPSWMSNSNVDQIGFDMLINLNESWGFHASKESTIDFTIYSDQSTGSPDKDLILSFSVDNTRYFSIFLTVDNFSGGNAVYPSCGTSLRSGDINNIISNPSDTRDREIKAFGFSSNLYRLQPSGNNYWPITFSIKNNPSSNRVYFSVDNPNIQEQTCEYSTAFPTNKGLQIYIGADDVSDQALMLTQFKIDYSFQLTYPPSKTPTLSPTKNPTTLSPSKSPTTAPTNNPTNNPSSFPTNNPSNSPTKYPTKTPTETPTGITISPSLQPTISPTNIPTTTPTKVPTNSPTITTQNPSISPTTSTLTPTRSQLPTEEDAGVIDDGKITTNASDDKITANASDDNGKLIVWSNNAITMYIFAIMLCSFCLCCMITVLYFHRKKRKQQKIKVNKLTQHHSTTSLHHTHNTLHHTHDKLHICNKKYGKALRLDSLSPSGNNNEFVIATDISISHHNMTSAVGINNVLMDDDNDVVQIVMSPADQTGGQTPRLPPPPMRMKSNEDIIDIQMSSMITPNGRQVESGTDDTEGTDDSVMDTGTGTDDLGTNESVMDKTLRKYHDQDEKTDDIGIMNDVNHMTLGGDIDENRNDVYNNPNVRSDEFVIGSPEGALVNNNNVFMKQ